MVRQSAKDCRTIGQRSPRCIATDAFTPPSPFSFRSLPASRLRPSTIAEHSQPRAEEQACGARFGHVLKSRRIKSEALHGGLHNALPCVLVQHQLQRIGRCQPGLIAHQTERQQKDAVARRYRRRGSISQESVADGGMGLLPIRSITRPDRDQRKRRRTAAGTAGCRRRIRRRASKRFDLRLVRSRKHGPGVGRCAHCKARGSPGTAPSTAMIERTKPTRPRAECNTKRNFDRRSEGQAGGTARGWAGDEGTSTAAMRRGVVSLSSRYRNRSAGRVSENGACRESLATPERGLQQQFRAQRPAVMQPHDRPAQGNGASERTAGGVSVKSRAGGSQMPPHRSKRWLRI